MKLSRVRFGGPMPAGLGREVRADEAIRLDLSGSTLTIAGMPGGPLIVVGTSMVCSPIPEPPHVIMPTQKAPPGPVAKPAAPPLRRKGRNRGQ